MPAAARASDESFVMSLPASMILPALGFITPVMLRSVLVLPTPLRPIRQKHWLSGTSNSTPRRMRLPPMESSSDWTESTGEVGIYDL